MKIKSVAVLKLYACATAMAVYVALTWACLAALGDVGTTAKVAVIVTSYFVCTRWINPRLVLPIVLDLFEPPTKGDDQ